MKKILIVDNNKNSCDKICNILQTENYDVYSASNCYDGYDTLKKIKPSLIISDLITTASNSFHFITSIKSNAVLKNIPFIIVSEMFNNEQFRISGNLGIDDFLVKPVSKIDLLLAVKNNLEKVERKFEDLMKIRKYISSMLPSDINKYLSLVLVESTKIKNNQKDIPNVEIKNKAEKIFKNGERLNILIEEYLLSINMDRKIINV
ncbi:MAG: response regulator [Bacteroidales bacterium]|nr:response regulator [Bacteroidales bacterium]MBN2757037.1 response regulator [Bacteroidales bacterium]